MTDLIVEVAQGKVQGKTGINIKGGTYYSFQGIPYAKPPIGDLRFKAPLPADPWEGIRDATKEGSTCYSRHNVYYDQIVGSEDCLYLNIYTPQLPSKEACSLKPVMFLIHGGAFIMGSGKTESYGPEYLLTEDVVLVTINYRLGLLGFLRLEDPSLGVPGNAGMKDMVMALKWVQKNIARFSGDPKSVTIFGGSAGAAAVHALVLSPMATGLFHRAILHSGCALNFWVFGGEQASEIAKLSGFDSTNEAEILKHLQSLPVEKLFETQEKMPKGFSWDKLPTLGLSIERNAIEPAFFVEHPLDIIRSGKYKQVPIIMGINSNEGMFVEVHCKRVFGKLRIDTDFETKIPYFLNIPKGTEQSLKIADKIKKGYYGDKEPNEENFQPYFDMWSDILFVQGIYKSMQEHIKNSNAPIYFYLLSADTDLNLSKKKSNIDRPGVCHADEVAYLFKTTYIPAYKENSVEEKISQRMVKLWTTFAKTGNPNPSAQDPLINVTWKPIEKEHYHCLDIGTELKMIENPFYNRMQLWKEIAKDVNNFK